MGDSNLSPLATRGGSATGNFRNKTALKPGRGLMDWVKLGHSGTDLTGTGGKLLEVSVNELSKHNKRNDAWMALRGKVYNVTPYMDFHPGGEDELMQGVGKDATNLFNEVHKWVNFESLLQKCLVGKLIENRSFFSMPSFLLKKSSNSEKSGKASPDHVPVSSEFVKVDSSKVIVRSSSFVQLPAPKFDWFQTGSQVNLVVYTKWKDITENYIIIQKDGQVIKATYYIQEMVFYINLELFKLVEDGFKLKVGDNSGKVDILLNKKQPDVRWSKIGRNLELHNKYLKLSDKEIEFIECKLKEKISVTHNTYLFVIEVPETTYLPVPIGRHILVRLQGNIDLVRPYTPVTKQLDVDSLNEGSGRFIYLFIKIYPNGALTPLLNELSVGSSIDISYPEGTFCYHQQINSEVTDLALLGAGTGITPLIKVMFQGLLDKKRVHMILLNKREVDIPWQKEFDSLVSKYSDYLKVTYVLSRADTCWKGYRGYVDQELLDDLLPIGDTDRNVYICICGPIAFTKNAEGHIKDLAYSENEYYSFLG